MRSTLPHNRGFIALTSVLIASVLVFTLAIGASLRSLSGSEMQLAQMASFEAFSYARSCAEHALLSVQDNPSYPGNETLVIGDGICRVGDATGDGLPLKTIRVESTVGSYTRRILIETEASSTKMLIRSWEEVQTL